MLELLKNLNSAQRQAVEHTTGPLLIVAGAGTGKTTVLTRKLAYLILEKKVPADQVLALTFTEKAAAEMEERVEQLLPFSYFDLWVSTFHSFGERILHEHALAIGLPQNFKLLSETEQWLMLRGHLAELNLDYYQPKGNPTKFLEALVQHFSRLKDEDITPEQYLDYAKNLALAKDSDLVVSGEAKRIQELADAYFKYQQLLLANNALDFGDLITYTIKLFKERPAILAKYRAQFKYLLVDEFQDTNYAQYDLIKLLAAPQQNLTVVGDDDQAIYKFRGASISNILDFKQDYPKAQQIVLADNYRSGQAILDLAHQFIKLNDPDRLESKLKINKQLISQTKNTTTIEHLQFKTAELEAQGVIKRLLALKSKQNLWDDFAILIRANSSADLFLPYLEQAGIPYQFLASKGLFRKPLVIDLLSYLRLLDNYHESRALYRVLQMPVFGLAPEIIMELLNTARQKNYSLFEALQLKPDPKISQLLQLIAKHTQLARAKGVGPVLLQFLEDSGYLKQITSRDDQHSQEAVLHLQQLYKYIEQFSATTDDPSVRNFITEINLISEAGEAGNLHPDFEAGPETLKIMTVHAAKGLEFSHVFIVNLVDKRFPSLARSEAIPLPEALIKEKLPTGDAHLQEERRLFYVAMTRAKQGLYFTSAEDYGGARRKKLSRFLIEAGLAKENKVKPTGNVKLIESAVIKPRPLPTKPYALKPDNKFSFTQLKAFSTCPWQFRFAHLLKIPVPGKASFSFGKTMHHTLQQFFQRLMEQSSAKQSSLFGDARTPVSACPSLDDLLEIYESSWIGDWYFSKANEAEYKKKGREALKEFYNLHSSAWPTVQYLEKGFNLKIGKHTIKGAIDRIDALASGNLELIDYKTGKLPKTKEDIEQLLLYALAVQDVFKQIPEKITYYYLEENKPLSFLVTAADLTKVKEWATALIEHILASDFGATPGRHCKFCDYRQICEFQK